MAKVSTGDLVISLCGHDKGDFLIVLSVDDVYVTICDGKRRKAEKNKKKKIKHIQTTGLNTDLIDKIPHFAVDATVRREIKRLRNLAGEKVYEKRHNMEGCRWQ